ncbi:MAG: hypothetical protein V1760_02825, partial [Candidatus Peregrinibacteria bacterium]
QHFLKYPHRAAQIVHCQNCTGDYLKDSKNMEEGYLVEKAEDCKHVYIGLGVKNSVDLSSFAWGEMLYEVASSIELNHVAFSTSTIQLHDSFYNFVCQSSGDLFGCVGMHRKNYCILNKQYSQNDYESLKAKIVEHMRATGEWGEFFPPSVSPFGYNETVANEYFPLSHQEVLERGWNFLEEDPKDFRHQTYVVPDHIKDVRDDILESVLTCEETGRNFRVIPQELAFYRRHHIPIPRRHPQVRHLHRLQLQNPRRLWDWHCAKCNVAIQTTYSPERPEMVYCDSCYFKEIY